MFLILFSPELYLFGCEYSTNTVFRNLKLKRTTLLTITISLLLLNHPHNIFSLFMWSKDGSTVSLEFLILLHVDYLFFLWWIYAFLIWLSWSYNQRQFFERAIKGIFSYLLSLLKYQYFGGTFKWTISMVGWNVQPK